MDVLIARDDVADVDPSEVPTWVQANTTDMYLSLVILTVVFWDACEFVARWVKTTLSLLCSMYITFGGMSEPLAVGFFP